MKTVFIAIQINLSTGLTRTIFSGGFGLVFVNSAVTKAVF